MNDTLIVDDNTTFRNSLRQILLSHFPNMSIEEAQDGTETFEKICGFKPRLIFIDIKLPGANGLEITQQIKEQYPNIIVIILSNYDLPEYKEAARMCGANFFMSKGTSSATEITSLVKDVFFENK